MRVVCNCDKWAENFVILDAVILYASLHGMRRCFKYCPWCGEKLIQVESQFKKEISAKGIGLYCKNALITTLTSNKPISDFITPTKDACRQQMLGRDYILRELNLFDIVISDDAITVPKYKTYSIGLCGVKFLHDTDNMSDFILHIGIGVDLADYSFDDFQFLFEDRNAFFTMPVIFNQDVLVKISSNFDFKAFSLLGFIAHESNI